MASAEVRFVGAWNPQRSELSSAAGLGVHRLCLKGPSQRKYYVRAERYQGAERDKRLWNSSGNYFVSGRNNVFLILKAVQNGSIGGAQSFIQQMYNLKDIPIPLLDASYSVVKELKKRMSFPRQEEGEIDPEYQNEPNSIGTVALLDSSSRQSPKSLNDQGARCAWPRRNDVSQIQDSLSGRADSILRAPTNQTNSALTAQAQTNFTEARGLYSSPDTAYPRCSWPRREPNSFRIAANTTVSSAPRCAWPRAPFRVASKSEFQEQLSNSAPRSDPRPRAPSRVNSKTQFQEQSPDSASQAAGKRGKESAERSVSTKAVGVSSIANSHSSPIEEEKTGDQILLEGPRCVWPKDRADGKAPDAKQRQDPERAIHPSDFPRRMLATSVGISLMNYLVVGQGASALAFPYDFLHSIDHTPPKKPVAVYK